MTAEVAEGKVRLRDGRTLAYVEWGTGAGPVIVLCHPSAGVVPAGWEVAGDMGLRVVSPDRPGTGRSGFQAGRSIMDWPPDVAELMTQLGVEHFSVVGVSACTAYALSCGVLLGRRLDRLGIIAGTVPHQDNPAGLARLTMSDREAALRELRLGAQQVVDDIPASVRRLGERPDPDGSLYRRPDVQAAGIAASLNTYRQGVEGPAYDALLRLLPWGFAIGDIVRPCLWWHGEADSVVPPSLIKRAIAREAKYELQLVPDAGHGICITHVGPFLLDLLR